MNRIQARYEKSEYARKPHLIISVDGKPLDVLLHECYPDDYLLGLVPTLLDWLSDPAERAVVWRRVQSESPQVLPILMCPDDVDLWCTVIHAEVEKTAQTVRWRRIGIDIGKSEGLPDSIGSEVKWLEKIEAMEFDRNEYERFISDFKTALEEPPPESGEGGHPEQ
jgi:hypothetical protein